MSNEPPFFPAQWRQPGARLGQLHIEHFFAARARTNQPMKRTADLPAPEPKRQASADAPEHLVESDDAPTVLDAQQQRAMDRVLAGDNVFITGAGGNGKSFTVRAIVERLRATGRRVAVTSSTGRSAVSLNLGATTLHHFLALGDTGTKDVAHYVARLSSWSSLQEHAMVMRGLDTLVIDEVSMLDGDFLDKASAIVAAVRRTQPSVPWGGVQIIFSGDFAQLRPVSIRGEPPKNLAFKAAVAWRAANVQVHDLEKAHRQSQDAEYARLLNCARFGRLLPDQVDLLRNRVFAHGAPLPDDMAGALKLFSTNVRADNENRKELERLDALTKRRFVAQIDVMPSPTAEAAIDKKPRTSAARKDTLRKDATKSGEEWLRKNMRALPTIEIRQGARVLLLANLNQAACLVNGSMGTVEGYDDALDEDGRPVGDGSRFPRVRFDHDGVVRTIKPHCWSFDSHPKWHANYKQVPLMLAYACTIHRVQGLTVDRVVADLSAHSIHDPGMSYVVLSRVRARAHIGFYNFSAAAVFADPEVLQFYGVR